MKSKTQQLILRPCSCCCCCCRCCCVSSYFPSLATCQPGVMETWGSASSGACGAERKHTCDWLKKRKKKKKETRSDVWLREGLKNIFDWGRNTAGTTLAAAAPDRSMLLEAIFTFNRTKCCAEVVSEWKLRIRFVFFLPFQTVFRRRESH